MIVVRTVPDLRAALAGSTGCSFVPTMGNLHPGHLALLAAARSLGAGPAVASIFVNRLQFLPHEDFDAYPRTFDADCSRLREAGCDVLFAPDEKALYPEPQTFHVRPDPALADVLEGEFRPGFFTGVCTVVCKLLNIVQPAVAVFGKKDYQQWLVVQQMVRQLALPVRIVAAETTRADDGLALSSRNGYLTPAQRLAAAALPGALRRVVNAVDTGRSDWPQLEAEATDGLAALGWKVDYIAVRRRADLGPPQPGVPLVVLGAARIGTTRLIDNVECGPAT